MQLTVRLLEGFLGETPPQGTKAANRRRLAKKAVKYLKARCKE